MELGGRHAGFAALLLALAVAGCESEQDSPGMQAGLCDPAAAETLVGQDAVSDARAAELTGAKIVRQVGPGDPVTMDFREERVTIETDPESGKIVRASCG